MTAHTQQEAVAWCISSPETGEFSFSPDKSVAKKAELNGYEVTPLYTRAAPQQEPVAYLLEYGGTDREPYLSRQEAEKMRREVTENGFLDVRLSELYTPPAPALRLPEAIVDWVCQMCASIYHTDSDDVAQNHINEIRATLERLNATAPQPVKLNSSSVMSRSYVVKAIRAAGYQVEGE